MYYSKNLKSIKSVAIALLTLNLVACGSQQNLKVKGMDIGTTGTDTSTMAQMEAIVEIGDLKLPNLEVPVYHPRTQANLGRLTLQSLSDGTNRISLAVNLTTVADVNPELGSTLPNNREIPLSLGAPQNALLGIPVLEYSRVYIGGTLETDLFLGVGLAIPALDSAMRDSQLPLNIFFSYPFSNQLSSVAGLFSGTEKGQNGIAVFGKRSANQVTSSFMLTHTQLPAQSSTPPESAVEADQKDLSKLRKRSMYRLYRLMKKRRTLRVH